MACNLLIELEKLAIITKLKEVLTGVFALVGGKSTQKFKVADATADDEAVNLGQMKNRFPFLIKKITGTTADTEGGTVDVAHGLTGGKIISISCKVENDTNGGIFPNGLWAHGGFEYSIYHDSTNVRVENHNTESEKILSKPFILTIMYEE